MDYYKLNPKGEVVKVSKREKKSIDEQTIAFTVTILSLIVIAIAILIGTIQATKIIEEDNTEQIKILEQSLQEQIQEKEVYMNLLKSVGE